MDEGWGKAHATQTKRYLQLLKQPVAQLEHILRGGGGIVGAKAVVHVAWRGGIKELCKWRLPGAYMFVLNLMVVDELACARVAKKYNALCRAHWEAVELVAADASANPVGGDSRCVPPGGWRAKVEPCPSKCRDSEPLYGCVHKQLDRP